MMLALTIDRILPSFTPNVRVPTTVEIHSARDTTCTDFVFQRKGIAPFSCMHSLQKKPQGMGISLQKNRAFNLETVGREDGPACHGSHRSSAAAPRLLEPDACACY